jgi:hypothetical protein
MGKVNRGEGKKAEKRILEKKEEGKEQKSGRQNEISNSVCEHCY